MWLEMKIGLYPIIDREFCQKNGKDILKWAESIARSSVQFLQYRDKISADLEYRETAEALLVICRKFGVKLIVNDRVDVAVKIGADGVHLGQEDIARLKVKSKKSKELIGLKDLIVGARLKVKSPKEKAKSEKLKEAKKLKDFIIGISTHNLDEAIKAAKWGADYIAIGPVFKTPTKPEARPIGLKEVAKVAQTVKILVVAIGGINLENVLDVLKTGISGVAAVRTIEELLARRDFFAVR